MRGADALHGVRRGSSSAGSPGMTGLGLRLLTLVLSVGSLLIGPAAAACQQVEPVDTLVPTERARFPGQAGLKLRP